MSLTRRLQILLDEDRYQRVAALASHRHMSVASVIREAIDRGLADPDAERRSAMNDILTAPPMEVPDVADLIVELDDLRARRA